MQIECFMAHLRNLLDFLFLPPRTTDVGSGRLSGVAVMPLRLGT